MTFWFFLLDSVFFYVSSKSIPRNSHKRLVHITWLQSSTKTAKTERDRHTMCIRTFENCADEAAASNAISFRYVYIYAQMQHFRALHYLVTSHLIILYTVQWTPV